MEQVEFKVTIIDGRPRLRLRDVARPVVVLLVAFSYAVGGTALVLSPVLERWVAFFGYGMVAFGLLVELVVWRGAANSAALAALASVRGRVQAFRDHESSRSQEEVEDDHS